MRICKLVLSLTILVSALFTSGCSSLTVPAPSTSPAPSAVLTLTVPVAGNSSGTTITTTLYNSSRESEYLLAFYEESTGIYTIKNFTGLTGGEKIPFIDDKLNNNASIMVFGPFTPVILETDLSASSEIRRSRTEETYSFTRDDILPGVRLIDTEVNIKVS